MAELAVPSFEWSNIRYNPSIVIRKDCKELQDPIMPGAKSALRKLKKIKKSLERLKKKFDKTKDLEKKNKLKPDIESLSKDYTSLNESFWKFFDNAGARLRRMAVNNLALFHRLRKDINDIIDLISRLPTSSQEDEDAKASIVNSFNEIKAKIKAELKELWLESKSNERGVLSSKLLKEAVSLERTHRKLTLIKRAAVHTDTFQGMVDSIKKNLKLRKLPEFVGKLEEQAGSLAEMGKRIKVVVHRLHNMADDAGSNPGSVKRFRKNLESVTANTRTLHTAINVSDYIPKKIPVQKNIQKAEKMQEQKTKKAA